LGSWGDRELGLAHPLIHHPLLHSSTPFHPLAFIL
jgi:hypothetical protein